MTVLPEEARQEIQLLRGGRRVGRKPSRAEVGGGESAFAEQQHAWQRQGRIHLPAAAVTAQPGGHLDHAQRVVRIGEAKRIRVPENARQGFADRFRGLLEVGDRRGMPSAEQQFEFVPAIMR